MPGKRMPMMHWSVLLLEASLTAAAGQQQHKQQAGVDFHVWQRFGLTVVLMPQHGTLLWVIMASACMTTTQDTSTDAVFMRLKHIALLLQLVTSDLVDL
jgi:hypothetical protein